MNQMLHEHAIELCLDGLKQLIIVRLKELKGEEVAEQPNVSLEALGRVFIPHLRRDQFHVYDGLLLTLALFPHIRPHLFDRALQEVFPNGGNFPELGGSRGNDYRGFLPTGITAAYLFGSDNLAQRFHIQSLLSPDYWLAKEQVLRMLPHEKGAPAMSGLLQLDPELVEKITIGRISRPAFSTDFPAAYISTEMEWSDLVLPESTQQQIKDVLIWLTHHRTFLEDWQMGRKFKPGYRVLFHGPPGTGKTLTASLLGKHVGMDVYKVDLSTVVSKYIGETEKNLANLFDRAENKNWILFFDEADALFGKRTQIQNSHDRFANQEVSFLLQRIETFNGLVILASNFKSNIDDAFVRRFHSIIHFPAPNSHERLLLWRKSWPTELSLGQDVNFKQISQKYELTGADIMNVIQYVSLQAIASEDLQVVQEHLQNGLRHEMIKSNLLI